MTSVDKKILQGGWQAKESSFPRSRFNTELDHLEETRKFPSKKPFKCKKSKGDHTWILVSPNGEPDHVRQTKIQYMANLYQPKHMSNKYQSLFSISKGASVFYCQQCNKVDIRWNK